MSVASYHQRSNSNNNNNNYSNGSADGVRLAGDNTKDRMYEPKHHQKAVRVLTVIAYIFFVSLAAIMLSLYYVFIWNPPPPPQPSKLSTSISASSNSTADCNQGILIGHTVPMAALETPKVMPVIDNNYNDDTENNDDIDASKYNLLSTTEMNSINFYNSNSNNNNNDNLTYPVLAEDVYKSIKDNYTMDSDGDGVGTSAVGDNYNNGIIDNDNGNYYR